MNSKLYRPFRDLDNFLKNCRDPLETGETETLRGALRKPSVDIEETDEHYVVRIEAPGVRPDDLHLALDGGVLYVRLRKSHDQPSHPRGAAFATKHVTS
jgi:HSP20 family protein